MASTYIKQSFGQAGTRTTMTWSFWIKRHGIGSYQKIFDADYNNSTDYYSSIYFKNDDTLKMTSYDNGSANIDWATSRLFRDVNAWYHIVITMDTTNATAGDRFRVYVNGERETLTGTYQVSQGTDNTMFNKTDEMFIGSKSTSVSDYLDASLSHFYFIDGTSYNASTFGSTDSTTGEWKINTSPSVTMGTNGFLIFKDGNTITDQSTNSNDWVLGAGTLTKTEDNPSNVFATLNGISGISHPTLEHGNNSVSNSASDGNRVYGTIPSKTGYYEVKLGLNPDGSSGKGLAWGVFDVTNYSETSYNVTSARLMKTNFGYNTYFATENFGGGNSWENISTGLDADAGDILMVAWKSGKVYFGYNGTWFFSANPSNNTDGSTQIPLADSNAYQVAIAKSNLAGMGDCQFNFGNGYFGTTAVSTNSGNGYQDANGQGKFNYQPPTGCYALCTKNLNV